MTIADYWINDGYGKYRTARKKEQICDNHWQDETGKRIDCTNKIKIGDKYLDTGELKGVWSTFHYCMECANRIIKEV